MSIDIRRFSSEDPEFEAKILELQAPIEALDPALVGTVRTIIDQVRRDGDLALLALTQKYDLHPAETMSALAFGRDQLKAFESRITQEELTALKTTAIRIQR